MNGPQIINYIRTKRSNDSIFYNVGGTPPPALWQPSVDLPNPINVAVTYESTGDYWFCKFLMGSKSNLTH